MDPNLGNWNVWQTLVASNSVIVPPPLNPGSNALFLDAALVWSTTTNGLPDWYEMEYFGNLNQPANGYYDGGTLNNGDAYTNGIDPNIITFTISCTNQNVNLTSVPLSLGIQRGVPYNWAVTVDNTNFGLASWTPYTSSNITANLGATPGWHTVWVGLRGLPANAQQTWNAVALNLSLTAPTLVVTNATDVTIPLLQLGGYANEELASLTFDLANANGTISNQTGFMTGATFDTNRWSCTNVTFTCFDLTLASGVNTVTLHATDLAGNLTSISQNFTLNYTNKPAPVIQLYWPQDGTQIGGSSFTLRGAVDDPTVALSAQITDTNGDTNIVAGVIERNGNFWVENIPLFPGTNYLTLTATDINTNVTMTNITIVQPDVQITIDPIYGDPNQPTVEEMDGTINATNYVLWVNGVAITNFDFYENTYCWSAYNVPMNGAGRAVVQARAIPITPSDNYGNGTANGGGPGSTLSNPGNPTAPDAVDVEIFQNKPAAIFCAYFHDRYTSAWQYVDTSHSNAVIGNELWINSTDWSSQTGGNSQSTDCAISVPADAGPEYYRIFQWQWDTSGNGIYQQAYTSNGCGAVTNLTNSEYYLGPVTFPGLQGSSISTESVANGTNCSGVITQQAASRFGFNTTGGLGLPGSQILFGLAANALGFVQPLYGDAYQDGGLNNALTSVPADPAQVKILGLTPGANGMVLRTLPAGAVILTSAIVSRSGLNNLDLTASNYAPIITANGIALDANTVNPNAAFCVGQNVTFAFCFPQTLPTNTIILSNQWSFSGTFFNNYSSNDFPTNSATCLLDTNLLKLATNSAWWISGGDPANANPNIPSLYQATCPIVLQFNDGTTNSLTTSGRFNMFRPVVTFSVIKGTVQVFTNVDNSAVLSCGDGTNNPGMSIFNTINYPTNFPGQCYWEQVFSSTTRTLTDTNGNLYTVQQSNPGPWLDNGESTNVSRYVYPFFNTNLFHSIFTVDSPYLPLPADFMRGHTDESLQMTMMFTPNGASHDVPLITIPWTWVGNAVFNPYFPYGWQGDASQGTGQIHTNSVSVNPGYPIWNSFWTDHEFNPPLP
jgi:hypothetical protein